jgi:hypothetical protein
VSNFSNPNALYTSWVCPSEKIINAPIYFDIHLISNQNADLGKNKRIFSSVKLI